MQYSNTHQVGVEDMSLYLPHIYLPIEDLAFKRNIPYEKLYKGLGLEKMSFCDGDEDVATMGAEAIWSLIQSSKLEPEQIGRIYLGTESAIDGAKPTATYMVDMIERRWQKKGCLRNCDVVDMTFACIGAVDAMQNCIDWVSMNPGQKAIVVASDFAKYELGSTGEYTQGAGAVAILISDNPKLFSIHSKIGVATESVHDFFKPLRKVPVNSLKIEQIEETEGALQEDQAYFYFHHNTPVFDGQFSNECYQQRISDAFQHFQSINDKDGQVIDHWDKIVFHLPYAAHARRICQPIFLDSLIAAGKLGAFCAENQLDLSLLSENPTTFYKLMSKTEEYLSFAQDKLDEGARASSQTGNLYTASIFLSLMSTLHYAAEGNEPIHEIGFFAYGSGSKSKVFSAKLSTGWEKVAQNFKLSNILAKRQPITFEQYEWLHQEKLEEGISKSNRSFFKLPTGGEGYLKHATFYDVKIANDNVDVVIDQKVTSKV
jgi:hydroxymethylglutaryl-CoA synthase